MEYIVVAVVLVLLVAVIYGLFFMKRQSPVPEHFMREIELFREGIKETIETNRELINQRLESTIQAADAAQQRLQKEVSELREHVRKSLEGTQKLLGDRLDNTSKVVKDVSTRLGELKEATANVRSLAKDISSLQEILRPPKLRGGLGELLLGELLGQILTPDQYELQHAFKSGDKVDAVIRLGGRLVPVDSKFPLENFRKGIEADDENQKRIYRKQFEADVKKHIDAIASKYIVPDEGTYDFALMYIPAENIYYETIIKDERFGDEKGIDSYALERKVIPVSPNSFFAYLQAIVLGLKGMKIEESAQKVLADLARLQKDYDRFAEDYRKLGKHLRHAADTYVAAEKRIVKFTDKLESITGVESAPELPEPTEPENDAQ